MDQRRANLILKLSDGDSRVLPVIHALEKLTRRDEVYQWFISKKVTGERFYKFCAEHRFSWLSIAKTALSALHRENREIRVGRDVL